LDKILPRILNVRIDVIMLISGLDEEGLRFRQESVSSYASPETDVRLVMTRNAPPSVESQAEMELAAPGILERVVQSEREGADAICFGCMGLNDHAQRLMDELSVSHPGVVVIHPGEAVIRFAELLVEMGVSHSKKSYPSPPKDIEFPV